MTYPSGKDALEAIYRKLQERAQQEVKMEREQERKQQEQQITYLKLNQMTAIQN